MAKDGTANKGHKTLEVSRQGKESPALHFPFTCDICEASKPSKNCRVLHRKKCRQNEKLACPHCRMLFRVEELEPHWPSCATRKFVCNICHLKFKAIRYLEKHTKRDHRVKLNISNIKKLQNFENCPHCSKKYASGSWLTEHIRRCHTPTKCAICKITIHGTQRAWYHELRKHTEPRYECTKCLKKFFCKRYFDRHLQSCNRAKSSISLPVVLEPKSRIYPKLATANPSRSASDIKCPRCRETLPKAVSLDCHMQTHHERITCDLCGKSLTGLYRVQNHQEKKHGKSIHNCPHCLLQFSGKASLKKHAFSCVNYKYHMERMHKVVKSSKHVDIENISGTEDRKQNSVGKIWSGKSPSGSSVESSAMIIRENRSPTEDSFEKVQSTLPADSGNSPSEMNETGNIFSNATEIQTNLNCELSCKICGRTFKYLITLNDHKQRHCIGLKKRQDEMYQCAYCLKRFCERDGLRKHVMICVTKKHSCELCGQKFNTLKQVKFHIRRMHEGSSSKNVYIGTLTSSQVGRQSSVNKTCAHCPMKFRDSSTLKKHVGICAARKYSCKLCDHNFKTLQSVKNHMIRGHKLAKPFKRVNIRNPTPKEDRKHNSVVSANSSKSSTNSSERRPTLIPNNRSLFEGVHGAKEVVTKHVDIENMIATEDRTRNNVGKTRSEKSLTVSSGESSTLMIRENRSPTEGLFENVQSTLPANSGNPTNEPTETHNISRRSYILIVTEIQTNQNNKYSCEICGQTFRHLITLKRHKLRDCIALKKRKDKMYQCDYCLKRFSNKDILRKHVLICVTKKYPCELCSQNFKTLKKLRFHIRRMHARMKELTSKHLYIETLTPTEDLTRNSVDNVDFAEWPATSSKESSPSVTQEIQTNVGNLTSKLSKVDNLSSKTNNHASEEVQTNVNFMFSCKLCGRPFRSLNILNNHTKHSCDTLYQCATNCPKKFRDSATLEKHMAICVHNKYPCELCDQKFRTLQCVKNHIIQVHKVVKPLRYFNIRNPTAKEDHKHNSVDSTNSSKSIASSMNSVDETRSGNLSKGSSGENSALRIRENRSPTEKPFEKVQSTLSEDSENLTSEANKKENMSRNVHNAKEVQTNLNYEHSCEICGQTFKYLITLKKHKQRDCIGLKKRQDEMYQCDYCLRRFSAKDDLRKHVIFCANQKHPSDICDKKYKTLKQVRIHIRRMHGATKPSNPGNTESLTPTKDLKQNSVDNADSDESPATSNRENSPSVTQQNTSLTRSSFKVLQTDFENLTNELSEAGKPSSKSNDCGSEKVQTNENFKISCKICGRVFRSLNILNNHKKYGCDALYQCAHCPKKFRDSSTLEKRMATCAAEKYPCKLCDQKFKTLQFVKNHMIRVHKAIKPLKHVNIRNPTPMEDGKHESVDSTNSSKSPKISSEGRPPLTLVNQSLNRSPFEDTRMMVHVHGAREVGANSLPQPEDIELKMEIEVEATMLQEEETTMNTYQIVSTEDRRHNSVNSTNSSKSPTSSSKVSSAMTLGSKSLNRSPFEDIRTMVNVHGAREVGTESMPQPEDIELKMEIEVEDTMLHREETTIDSCPIASTEDRKHNSVDSTNSSKSPTSSSKGSSMPQSEDIELKMEIEVEDTRLYEEETTIKLVR